MSVDSTELQRATLERKKSDELNVIAAALGVKPGSRAKKADLVDLILQATGVTGPRAADDAPAPAEMATAVASAAASLFAAGSASSSSLAGLASVGLASAGAVSALAATASARAAAASAAAPLAGSVTALYLLTGLFIAAVLGLGMLVSTIAQTQGQASQLTMMLALPFIFLSGYVFPIEGMPAFFQWLCKLVPANYAIQIIRGIVLRGASWVELWEPIMWLSFYTVIIVVLAAVRFKKTAA